MEGGCALFGCKGPSRTGRLVRFIKFGQDLERYKMWTEFCEKPWKLNYRSSYLCSDHFERKFFQAGDPTLTLIKSSRPVPTLKPPLQLRKGRVRKQKEKHVEMRQIENLCEKSQIENLCEKSQIENLCEKKREENCTEITVATDDYEDNYDPDYEDVYYCIVIK